MLLKYDLSVARSHAEKVSISLPAALLRKARKLAGPRGLSAFAAKALGREIKLRELASYLDELRVEMGAPEPELLDEAREAWRQVSSSTRKR
ncbi:MAG: hypothetical protein RL701_4371 [Pseudomonadota bacterium]|jgi:hypothetical protein